MMLLSRRRLVSLLFPFLAPKDAVLATEKRDNKTEYIIVGVSGGLQKGFPEHQRLDYNKAGDIDNPAVFLGRGLVRGYKSYLDVMEPTWRQYVDPENTNREQALINCNVIPTGCYHDANEYWIYLVDMRQLIPILMNEPRFLSITPDLGLVDLEVGETSDLVKYIARHEISRQPGKTDTSKVAFPIVTGAWLNPTSHVPSPILYTKSDGTRVTNFPGSLAKWIGYQDVEKSIQRNLDTSNSVLLDTTESIFPTNPSQDGLAPPEFWDLLTMALREAEKNRGTTNFNDNEVCTEPARFGVSAEMARINYSFSASHFSEILRKGGYHIDYERSSVRSLQ